MTVFGEMTQALSAIVLTTFGEPVMFHLEGQTAPIESTGVFTAAHMEADASTGVAVSTVQPLLEVVAANLPGPLTEGDAVMVRGVLYLIVDVRPDGHGFLKLMLHRGTQGEHRDETSPHPDP